MSRHESRLHPRGGRPSARFRRSALASAIALASLAAGGAAAQAAPLAQSALLTETPPVPYAQFGRAAQALGDVNGDGLGDLFLWRTKTSTTATAYITFGSRNPAELRAPTQGGKALAITAPSSPPPAPPQPAGDLDGDGYADIVLRDQGRSWVVFGAPGTGGTVTLTPGGPRVMTIANNYKNASPALDPIGDFNGDGYDDLIMERASDAVIVLGGPRLASIDATSTGPRLAVISGITRCGWGGLWNLTYRCTTTLKLPLRVGDINGDGKDDLFLRDRSFLLLGRAGNAALSGAGPDSRSINLPGAQYPTVTDEPVRAGDFGDLTGDGVGDLVLVRGGAPSVIPGRRIASGTIDATTAPSIAITGGAFDVQPAGDQNGDGRQDLAVTNYEAVRIVSLPTTAPATVDGLAAPLVPANLRSETGSYSDYLLSGRAAGDLDGDGTTDLLIRVPLHDEPGAEDAGAVVLATHAGGTTVPPTTPVPTTPKPTTPPATTPKPTTPPATTPTTTTPAPASSGFAGWTLSGQAALQPGGGVVLVPASQTGGGTGAAYDTRKTIDANRVTVEFDATLDGGTGSGNGFTLAFASGSQGGFARAGNADVGLGWIPNKGAAIVFGTVASASTPGDNYVGITTAAARYGYPALLASGTPPARLAGRTTHVKVVAAGGTVTVTTDGTEVLRRAMTLPTDAWLGLTASTGGRTQRHLIEHLTVSTS